MGLPLSQNAPVPQGGASLIMAFHCKNKRALVIGTSAIAARHVQACLEADARVSIAGALDAMNNDLRYHIQQKHIFWLGPNVDVLMIRHYQLVFVCDTRDPEAISQACRSCHIPVHVHDKPEWSDFSLPSTHRDESLQFSISTNGQALRLEERLLRQMVGQLPSRLGQAVKQVGVLRDSTSQPQLSSEQKEKRLNWIDQLCNYWSMDQLAQLSMEDMENLLLGSFHGDEGYHSPVSSSPRLSHLTPCKSQSSCHGTLSLVGSGPGDPDLLTMAAYRAIKEADLVLADKIVPDSIIKLVECELKIARKFPGNADKAQEELNIMALDALAQGKNVVRLKQGDPFLFGRGGEEVLFFREHGYSPRVIPGLSSATTAPLLASIPLSHRSLASQFLVTTGTGAKGTTAPLPVYDEHRTDVFLMSIHRLDALVRDLVDRQQYPSDTPCAIIERASCPDQRVLRGTLARISSILESAGGSRPPGLLVVGKVVDLLHTEHHSGLNELVPTFTDKNEGRCVQALPPQKETERVS